MWDWLSDWQNQTQRRKQMMYCHAVCLLSGKFDRCLKHKLKQKRDETARSWHKVWFHIYIIGICYLNGTQPQITTLAETLMLLRLLNQDDTCQPIQFTCIKYLIFSSSSFGGIWLKKFKPIKVINKKTILCSEGLKLLRNFCCWCGTFSF